MREEPLKKLTEILSRLNPAEPVIMVLEPGAATEKALILAKEGSRIVVELRMINDKIVVFQVS